MIEIFDKPEFIMEQTIVKRYPHSRYILQDIKDVNHIEGYLLAVSTERASFKQLCVLRDKYIDKGLDVALLGSYGGTKIGVLG